MTTFRFKSHAKRALTLLLVLAMAGSLAAQELTGISISWSADFSEWTLLATEESGDGTLETLYPTFDQWTEWEYSFGDQNGTIRKKFAQSDIWELSGPNTLVTMKPVWPGNPREWRITNNDISLTFKTKWGNRADEWITRSDRHGVYYMYTLWENDPRDWEIVDDLNEDIPFELKMAMTFIAVFHSSPKIK